jgi:uncharacterized protein
MIYELKNLSGGIEDLDLKTNKVTGYASTFGNVDSDGDMMMPGAFTKSLADPGKRQLHLYQHDSYRPLASVKGGSLKLSEDAKGLKFESQIVDTSWGKDVMKLIEAKVLNENSIGFMTVRAKETKAARELHELKLFEVSSCSWGANDQALNLKSLYTDELLQARVETVLKASRNGSFTDETHSQLEIYLLQLNQLLIESKSTKPAVQAAARPVIDEKVIQRITAWNSLFKTTPKAIDPRQALAGRLMARFKQS